jgi:hypothetical protein
MEQESLQVLLDLLSAYEKFSFRKEQDCLFKISDISAPDSKAIFIIHRADKRLYTCSTSTPVLSAISLKAAFYYNLKKFLPKHFSSSIKESGIILMTF